MNLHKIPKPLPTQPAIGVHVRIRKSPVFHPSLIGATGMITGQTGWLNMWAIAMDNPTALPAHIDPQDVRAYTHEFDIIP